MAGYTQGIEEVELSVVIPDNSGKYCKPISDACLKVCNFWHFSSYLFHTVIKGSEMRSLVIVLSRPRLS